ncbi:FTR1 family iron permease [Rummeliibacillus suwonensis]|uniref:FTR1 family iron permease n=1 Tax=Rummeliibacillus suwonensis TaxID=1306154 RepID=UPI0011B3D1A3|nr:FTR1 family protein [Rummeliibacillus suwonensis]
MKHYLTRCSQFIIILFVLLATVQPVFAAESYRDLYISISDAIMNSKQGNDTKAEKAVQSFEESWNKAGVKESKESKAVEQALDQAKSATTDDERLKTLTTLSKALTALEKAENPVDEKAERKTFLKTMTPELNRLETVMKEGNIDKLKAEYNHFNIFWNQKEKPVRSYDVAAYGQIETQISFMRITLADENPSMNDFQDQFNTLKKYITAFGNNKKVSATSNGTYSLQTLIDLIDDAKTQIDDKDYTKAASTVKKFITTWPNVEGDIRTKNASLYTKIESDMPIIASDLMKDAVDAKDINSQLDNFKQQIQLIQDDQSYSFWDSALILLREGLEALLIIIALVAFLKRSGNRHMEIWIYIGAGIGVAVSAVLAILMSTIFNSSTINTSREMIEGYVGLIAAAMMIGVGVWLHSKSNIKAWNAYIAKQINHAMSKQSVWAMAFISFLSVFREGAETLIFYMGIAPKMSTADFSLGIAIAIAILSVVAFLLLRVSGKIPIHRFFAVATIFIYILAFKIIGVSIHTLQLTDTLPSTVLNSVPVWAAIGFYPTVETIIGQVILLVLIALTIIYKKRKNNRL